MVVGLMATLVQPQGMVTAAKIKETRNRQWSMIGDLGGEMNAPSKMQKSVEHFKSHPLVE